MAAAKPPKPYQQLKSQFKDFLTSYEELGKVARSQGPLDEKTSHLIQLAAAAAIRSEGSVHSHTRRAIEAGATPEEVYHSIILLTTTIGFPTVAAALTWVEDVMSKKKPK